MTSQVIAATRFDPSASRVIEAPEGATLADMVELAAAEAAPDQRERMEVTLMRADGSVPAVVVPRDKWGAVRPRTGTVVIVRVVPAGGDFLRTVLMLAVVVVASLAAPELGAFLATNLGGFSAATWTAIATAAITTVGALAVNALVPLRAPSLGSTRAASPTYTINGTRNQLRQWGVVPSILGRHRVYPDLECPPYTESIGEDQYIRASFLGGYGELEWSDLRIGETPLEEFDELELQWTRGIEGETQPTIYPDSVIQDDLSVDLTHEGGRQVRVSATSTNDLSIDLGFGRGLYHLSDKGARQAVTVQVLVECRPVGASTWTAVTTLTVTEAKGETFRVGHRWLPPEGLGQYEVGLTRLTEDHTDTRTASQVTWTALRAFRPFDPVQFPHPISRLQMRIKATGQLNGMIDSFNGIAQRILPDWDAGAEAWISRATRSPAAALRHILTGRENARRRPVEGLAMDTFVALAEWCTAKGMTYDRVHDYDATVQDVLDDVAAAGRAICRPYNGLWHVTIDRPQTIAYGHVTPRNASDFGGTPTFGEKPDALRVRFVDETNGWIQSERIVPRPGLVGSPSLYAVKEYPGKTNPDEIWREARRDLRAMDARSEEFTATLHWESLSYRIGQLVYGNHWLLAEDQISARIARVDGLAVLLDEPVTMVEGKTYGLRWRSSSWESAVSTVATRPGTHRLLVLAEAPEVPPEIGDLALFGRATYEKVDLLVKAVNRQDGDAARLTLVAHAPEIDADDDVEPEPWVPVVAEPRPWAMLDPAVPVITGVTSGTPVQEVGADGSVSLPVVVALSPGAGSISVPVDLYEVGLRPAGGSTWTTQTVAAGTAAARFYDHAAGEHVQVRARAISLYGRSSGWTDPVDHVVQARDDLPPDIASLSVVRLASGLRRYTWSLDLPADAPRDLFGYRLAARPGAGWTWDDLTPLHSGIVLASPWETASPVTEGPHTIGIVAVDVTGQESAHPKLIEVTLGPASGPGLLLQRIEAALAWPGIRAGATLDGDALTGGAGLPSALSYALPVIDLGADIAVDVDVAAYGVAGTAAIAMQTGLAADGAAAGVAVPTGAVTARYIAITVTVTNAGAPARIGDLVTIITPLTVAADPFELIAWDDATVLAWADGTPMAWS